MLYVVGCMVYVVCSWLYALCSWLYVICSWLYAICSWLYALCSWSYVRCPDPISDALHDFILFSVSLWAQLTFNCSLEPQKLVNALRQLSKVNISRTTRFYESKPNFPGALRPQICFENLMSFVVRQILDLAIWRTADLELLSGSLFCPGKW